MSIPIFILIVIILLLIIIVVALPVLRGAPYYPTGQKEVKVMLKLAKPKKGDKMADLGSGDGRIIAAFAENGIAAHGFEINPLMVLISKLRIRNYQLKIRPKVILKDFWFADLSHYQIITVFGEPPIMGKLEKKLMKELKPGSRILSYAFKFPNLEIQKSELGVHLYTL